MQPRQRKVLAGVTKEGKSTADGGGSPGLRVPSPAVRPAARDGRRKNLGMSGREEGNGGSYGGVSVCVFFLRLSVVWPTNTRYL